MSMPEKQHKRAAPPLGDACAAPSHCRTAHTNQMWPAYAIPINRFPFTSKKSNGGGIERPRAAGAAALSVRACVSDGGERIMHVDVQAHRGVCASLHSSIDRCATLIANPHHHTTTINRSLLRVAKRFDARPATKYCLHINPTTGPPPTWVRTYACMVCDCVTVDVYSRCFMLCPCLRQTTR